jgi:hypothetical protein
VSPESIWKNPTSGRCAPARRETSPSRRCWEDRDQNRAKTLQSEITRSIRWIRFEDSKRKYRFMHPEDMLVRRSRSPRRTLPRLGLHHSRKM